MLNFETQWAQDVGNKVATMFKTSVGIFGLTMGILGITFIVHGVDSWKSLSDLQRVCPLDGRFECALI